MRNFFSGKVRYLDWRTSALDVKRKAMRCLLILLFLGIISGSLFGLFSEKATATELLSFAADNWSYESVWKALLFAAKDFLLLFFSASSYLGFLIVPVLVWLKAYRFSFGVAACFAAFAERGLLYAFLAVGIPSLVVIPVFQFAATESFMRSRQMFKLRFDIPFLQEKAGRSGAVLVSLITIIIDALYAFLVVPALLTCI